MATLFAFIGGLGIGGVVVSIVNHALESKRAQRERLLAARQTCYAGYLEAAGNVLDAKLARQRPSNQFSSWESRAQLVASDACMTAMWDFGKVWVSMPSSPDELSSAYSAMLVAMRQDLGFPRVERK